MILNNNNKFSLQTKNNSYVFGIDNNGLVRHIYWGNKVENIDDFTMPELVEVSTNDPVFEITPEEYPVNGSLRYKEHCLKVKFSDGCREIVYKYTGHTVNDNELIIHLKDNKHEFFIDLHYVVYEEFDIIERFTVIKNQTNEVIEVEQIQSAQFHMPYQDMNFSNMHGYWGAELQKFKQKVSYGKIKVENRRGMSTHNHNPFFILDRDANEDNGEVYFGALKLSGNFSCTVEQTQYGETLAQIGINNYDFKLTLNHGEDFKTPGVISGYTDAGYKIMSNNLHRFANEHIITKKELRPVLYNSWEAMEFKVNCAEQRELSQKASEIGAELFVVDDGWFGQRHSTKDGLGDWYVNEEKFPNGLNPLISKVKDQGMLFGIWVEPEMVNPESQLYKDHPEWIYHYEGRVSDTSRDQYVLNITKKEVRDFIFNMIDNLLSNYDIDYIKWDVNRPVSQAGLEQNIWYKHIETVYDILRELKEKHTKVLFEGCASGGGRVDYGSLSVYDDFWTSDNTDAYDRLTIQDSYSHIYPAKAMRAWVTDCPNFLSKREIPLRFRYHSAMMGTLGVGCNLLKFTQEDIEISKELIKEYKSIRHIVQDGDMFRLNPITNNDYYSFQFVKEDESILFVYLPQTKIGHEGAKIRLKGLRKDVKYKVIIENEEIFKSGEYLMNFGLDIKLIGDYSSTIVKISKM